MMSKCNVRYDGVCLEGYRYISLGAKIGLRVWVRPSHDGIPLHYCYRNTLEIIHSGYKRGIVVAQCRASQNNTTALHQRPTQIGRGVREATEATEATTTTAANTTATLHNRGTYLYPSYLRTNTSNTATMFRPTYDSEEEANYHLPRILMFHGGGTNSRIFRAQTRVLRRLLSPYFRFVFVEAPYMSYPGSDVVKVFQDMGPFKGWLRWREEDCYRDHVEATQRIHDAIEAAMVEDDMRGGEGEWVGVLGFSQGAKLAASLLYTQQYQAEVLGKPSQWPRFKFGILLQGRAPFVWLDAEEEVPAGLVDATALSTADYSNLAPIPQGRKLHIPTLHVHGLQDPNIQLHRALLKNNCDGKTARLLELDVAHRVPVKSADCTALAQEVLAIARKSNAI